MHELTEPAGLRALQLRALTECRLLDAGDDGDLAALTRLAASLTGYPVAVVTALLPDRTRVVAHAGGQPASSTREESLCHRASLQGGPVACGDCSSDPRFAGSPWVDGRLGSIRRYAMAPLVVDGTTVGGLCVHHPEAGPPLTGRQLDDLVDLAGVVSALLEGRRRDGLATAVHDELARSRAFDRALLQALPLGVLATDPDGRTLLVNDTLRQWFGDREDLGATATPQDRVAAYDLYELDGTTPLAPERLPLKLVLDGEPVGAVECVIRPDGGPERTLSSSGALVRGDREEVIGAVMAVTDVTEQRALQARLLRSATHDALTGLPNRALLVERLAAALEERPAGGGAPGVAVLYCDLDGFKAVNDGHGHAAGDAVLVAVAQRLRAALRADDVVARIGGDEFVLVCPGVADLAEADAIARRLAASVALPVEVDGVLHRVGVSVGAVLGTAGGGEGAGEGGAEGGAEGAERLLSAADAAMYARKRARRARRQRRASAAPPASSS